MTNIIYDGPGPVTVDTPSKKSGGVHVTNQRQSNLGAPEERGRNSFRKILLWISVLLGIVLVVTFIVDMVIRTTSS